MLHFESQYENYQITQDILCIFSGQLEGDNLDYSAEIQRIIKRCLKPDRIVFIYPEYLSDQILFHFTKGERCYDAITRLGRTVPIDIYSFGMYAKLKRRKSIYGNRALTLKSDLLTKSIIQGGLHHLVRDGLDNIILKAPPGTVFSKPSGESLEMFIKTAELTRNSSEQQFLGFCLLSKFPKNREIKKIYVDTASISSIIEAAVYYLYKFSGKQCKYIRYQSFSSYSGLDSNKPKNVKNIWVIISASTSNNLGMKVAEKWNVPCEQIVTLLSLKNKNKSRTGDDVLTNISDFVDASLFRKKVDSKIRVQVVGENFTAEVSEPKSILIKERFKPNSIKRSILPFYSDDVFFCNRASEAGSSVDPKPLYIEYSDIFMNKESYSAWLDKVVSWHLSSNIRWVVLQKNNTSSLIFLKHIEALIKKNRISKRFEVIDFSDVEKTSFGNETILVLDPVISSGKAFLELNRSFRLAKHSGNRIFLSAFVTSTSEKEFKNFKNSLIYASDDLRYLFLNYYQINIGHKFSCETWTKEAELCKALGSYDLRKKKDRGSSYWRDRAKILQTHSSGIKGNIGLAYNLNKGLGFTEGLAFWDDRESKYDIGKVKPEAVFATIAAVIQELREPSTTVPMAERLDGHVYQQAVIDPENFTRYNDALLHSCIWRCSEPAELDYRRSDELASSLVDIIVKMMSSGPNSPKAESVVDFLVAFAIDKIRVTQQQKKRLLQEARNCFKRVPSINRLINYMD